MVGSQLVKEPILKLYLKQAVKHIGQNVLVCSFLEDFGLNLTLK
jgi:hypothetical protein